MFLKCFFCAVKWWLDASHHRGDEVNTKKNSFQLNNFEYFPDYDSRTLMKTIKTNKQDDDNYEFATENSFSAWVKLTHL